MKRTAASHRSITRARFRSVILHLRPALHRRPVRLQRDQIVADASNPLDQVFAGRIIPAVNGVRVGSHAAIVPD